MADCLAPNRRGERDYIKFLKLPSLCFSLQIRIRIQAQYPQPLPRIASRGSRPTDLHPDADADAQFHTVFNQ
ncbi:hypothetical protein GJ744_001117 [Endocarpon pusillum]|uniref:Uncharacterized protein n=1 Tax=Endocarpon pusillum TaxID=364733 RepID=A0A8H7DZQ3_9EURO|nr:hypothetical protein GJ744_001117 [Endocarpon pusillum]